MRTWEEALKEHKAAVLAAGFAEENILGIFAYGSQNYGVATETSDWDTKAVIVPSYEDLVLQPPVSREIHLANREHCEVKDIREMVNMFKKQNINFIEVLFTEYKWVNGAYMMQWQNYFEKMKHDIAHYDVNKTVQSICGQAIHTLHQNPFDGKKVANGYRLLRFLEKYLAGDNYSNCIVLSEDERQKIIEMKKTKNIEDISIANDLLQHFHTLKEQSFDPDEKHAAAVAERMKEGILSIMNVMIFY